MRWGSRLLQRGVRTYQELSEFERGNVRSHVTRLYGQALDQVKGKVCGILYALCVRGECGFGVKLLK